MKRHRCKLCYRNFANGRALGGHMRFHMMNQITISDEDSQENDESQISYSSSSSEDQENRKKGSFLLDQEPSVVGDHHGDDESEAESTRNKPLSRIRSKRVRKSRVFYSERFDHMPMKEQSPLSSSVSNTSAEEEEEVAYCLMMLSRNQREKMKIDRVRERKYRCETCSKCFRSYQALGGHRASHKKIKASEAVPVVVHECPFCDRVFASGQALGGHKRTHFCASSAISPGQFSRNGQTLDIDLNLPAHPHAY